MRQNYFVHQGVRYYSGTTIIVKQYDRISGRPINVNATFRYYDTDKGKYAYSIKDCTTILSQKYFDRAFMGVTENIVTKQDLCDKLGDLTHVCKANKHTFREELNVDGMFVAWIWYVCIMAVAIIFNARIGIWILASIMFCSYRNKKLKEAGLKK